MSVRMSELEYKLAKIIKANLRMEHQGLDVEELAIKIVRELSIDKAFDILTGGNKPTIQINEQLSSFHRPYRCRCDSPVEKCDPLGCHCTLCGFPT